MGSVRVSVIMIFFNAAKFMTEAVESVLTQTYAHWELLLVDDGSTDASTETARHWAGRYPQRIRYFEHPGHVNRGMSASRNLGIRSATGEYIAFLDADDVYLPEKLERQIAILDAQPKAAMVYSATQYWYSWTGRKEDARRDRLRTLGVPTGVLLEPPSLVALFLRDVARTPAICSCLLRRNIFEQIGGFEEAFRNMLEDQAFFFKLCMQAPVIAMAGCWDRYRQHAESCCELTKQSGKWQHGFEPNAAHQAFVVWFAQYLEEKGASETEINALLERKLWPYRHPVLSFPRTSYYRLRRLCSIGSRSLIRGGGTESRRLDR